MRVMSGTYLQLLPTGRPPYFKHSFFVRDDQSMVVLYCRKEESISMKHCSRQCCSGYDRTGTEHQEKHGEAKGGVEERLKPLCLCAHGTGFNPGMGAEDSLGLGKKTDLTTPAVACLTRSAFPPVDGGCWKPHVEAGVARDQLTSTPHCSTTASNTKTKPASLPSRPAPFPQQQISPPCPFWKQGLSSHIL